MEVFELFVVGRQETCGRHGVPTWVSWAERVAMIGGAEIVLARGKEISFHLSAPFFTPRMFHHHEGGTTICRVRVKV